MNILALQNSQTMSSRDIADLVESRHDSVKRSMETLRDKGLISFSQSVETSHDGAGARPVEVYMVGKRDSYVIVAQLSPEFTARLVDRWQELEASQQFTIPTTLSGALRLAAEQAETIESQQALIEQQKPAVAFVERYVEARSSKCLSDVAKILQRKPKEFISELAIDKVIFKRGGNWVAYQDYIDRGLFSMHTGESSGHAFVQTKVEPEGIVWLARRYGKDVV